MEITIHEVDYTQLSTQSEILAGLAREIWTEYYTDMIGAAQVEYMLANFQSAEKMAYDITERGFRYWLAFDSDTPVGYCGAVLEPTRVFLSKVYVLESHRGVGITKSFLDILLSWKAEAGVPTIELTVHKYNPDAIAAYEKLGFTRDSDIVMDIGGGFIMDDYLMVRH